MEEHAANERAQYKYAPLISRDVEQWESSFPTANTRRRRQVQRVLVAFLEDAS